MPLNAAINVYMLITNLQLDHQQLHTTTSVFLSAECSYSVLCYKKIKKCISTAVSSQH
eukprot:c16525_g1_i1 orf=351-524(-)